MLINVTQEHIDNGLKRTCGKCPVALALLSAGAPDPFVGKDMVWIDFSDPDCMGIVLPKEAHNFIHEFDEGKKVEPFSFTLNIN